MGRDKICVPAIMVSSHAATTVFLVAFFSSLAITHGDSGAFHGPISKFGYTSGSPHGPENWGNLCPECRICSEGKKQSPIDINTKQAISAPNLDSLTRTYASTEATIVNNGHDIVMSFAGKVGNVTVNGKMYNLEKIHWHTPSEHSINGQKFPLEMHLVHKSDDGDLAVIGILYQLGAPDSFCLQLKSKLEELDRYKCNFTAGEEAKVEAGLVHLRSLQKRTGNYFRYSGSLTTPPCKENVVWNILGKVRTISQEQINLLTIALPGQDNRPTQPLNGRIVQFYNPPNSSISFEDMM